MIKLSHYFPAPSFLTMPSFALDISDQSIKYGEIRVGLKGLHLEKFGKVRVPPGIIVSGKIADENGLINILKDLAKKEKSKFVRVALPEEQMYLFNLLLPKAGGNNLREMILLQIEEHIPLKAEEALFDYEVIFENENNLFVQVAAIPAVLLNQYLSVFERSGFIPISFELEGQAIARSIIVYGDPGTAMIVDFGETRTGICIVSHGKVLFTSTLDIGGNILTEMIAKNYNVSYEKAEKIKKKYLTEDTKETDNIFPIILNGLSVLRDELNKHFAYWETHENETGTKHDPISKIILCGGNASLPGLLEYFSSSMKIKVECANVWINILDTKKTTPAILFEESLTYPTVIGLALGDYFPN